MPVCSRELTLFPLCGEDWPDNRRRILHFRRDKKSLEQCQYNNWQCKVLPCLGAEAHVRSWFSSGTCQSYIQSHVLHHHSCRITKIVQREVHLVLRVCSHRNWKLQSILHAQNLTLCRFSETWRVSLFLCSLRNKDGNFGSNRLVLENPHYFVKSTWIHMMIVPYSCRFILCITR